MQFPGKYCKIKLQEGIDMKKILTISLIFTLLFTGVCFAEKSKLKKKSWTPVQTRVENSIEVQDFYNHMEVHHEGDKQIGLWFVTFIPNQKGVAHSYFYEAVVMDYTTGKYRIIRAYQADRKNKKVKTSDQRFIDPEWKAISGTKYETLYYRMKPSIW
ncbi:MAG TPA: hypothetical protein DEG55_00510 [Acidaminococcaceae bacterium]|nr:hypothetical protein [Acidaminococcaceae bacterium]